MPNVLEKVFFSGYEAKRLGCNHIQLLAINWQILVILYCTEQDGSDIDLDKTQVANKLSSSSICALITAYYPVQLKLVVNIKTVNETRITQCASDFSSGNPQAPLS